MHLVARVRLIALAVSLALTSALTLTSGVASAANADDAAAAEALFNRGRQLMGEGKYAEACPKLAESQRLDPGAGTALNLADCYERAGRTATAWATWIEAATLAKQNGQADREELARGHAKTLESKLTRLTIELAPGAKVDGLRVTRSGTEVREVSFGVPLPVDPGEQVIEASAPGYQTYRTTVRAEQPGGQTTVKIPQLVPDQGGAAPAPEPTIPASQPASAPPATGSVAAATPNSEWKRPKPVKSARRTVGKVLTFVGIGGVAIGAVSASLAMGANEASKDECNPSDPNRCSDQGVADRNSARSYGNIATWTTVAGGVLVTTGLVLWISAPSQSTQVGALSTGDDARVVVRGSF